MVYSLPHDIMKQTEAQQVGDILKAMMMSDGNEAEFNRQKVCFLWSDIVGPVINQATVKRYVDKDVMHVFLDSGPLKSELAFVKSALVEKINEAVGKKVIKDLIIH